MSKTDAPERHLPLDGAKNFRDLGGYRGTEGLGVRWRAVYRSDRLSDLSDADHRRLEALDLELVCDLRSDSERAEQPDRLAPGAPRELTHIPVEVEGGDRLRELVLSGERDLHRLRAVFVGVYREFVHVHQNAWSRVFQALLKERSGAIVFHCSAGQDRTGFASALLLFALGVPRQVVIDDYMLTTVYRPVDVDLEGGINDRVASVGGSPLPPSLIRGIWSPGPDLLEASFDAMESGYGSIEGYLSEIGVDDRTRRALRDRLLVPS